MKEYIENLGLEATIAIAGVLGSMLTWILAKIANYKRKIKDDIVTEQQTDKVQDGKLLNLSSKLSILESIVDGMQAQIKAIGAENRIIEQKVYAHLNRVETKVDKVYTLLVERNNG